MEGCCLLAYSTTFLLQPRFAYSVMVLFTVCRGPATSINTDKNASQTWPEANLIEAIPKWRCPLPAWIKLTTDANYNTLLITMIESYILILYRVNGAISPISNYPWGKKQRFLFYLVNTSVMVRDKCILYPFIIAAGIILSSKHILSFKPHGETQRQVWGLRQQRSDDLLLIAKFKNHRPQSSQFSCR